MKKIILFFALALISSTNFAQIISTIAGNGTAGYSGDGGVATLAKLSQPTTVAVDIAGNLYIADNANNVIRKRSPSGIITTIAGTGVAGYSGDGGAATSAQLNAPWGVRVDAIGNIYIGDCLNNVIRKINTSGIITTIAGNGTAGYSGDGGLATAAQLNFCTGVAVDAIGNVFISDDNNDVIRMVDTTGIISTVAGNGTCGYSGDGGSATAAQLCFPVGIQTDAGGNLYISDNVNNVVRKVSPPAIVTGGPQRNPRIISTIAGNGTPGYSGDGGLAPDAQLQNNFDVTFDANGNFYIADWGNSVIRKVNSLGIISTFAGNGTTGYSGDGGAATSAQLNGPLGVAVDTAGNLFIADWNNNVVRKVSTSVPILPDHTKDTIPNKASAGPDAYTYQGLTTRLNAYGGVSYSWHPHAGLSNPNVASPYVTINHTKTYVVKITLANGQIIHDSATVFILGPYSTAASCGNIIANPSFNIPPGGGCPNQVNSSAITFIPFPMPPSWIQPTQGSPDYFNTCNPAPPTGNQSVQVPINFFGTIPPHSGSGYMGIIPFGYVGTPGADYSEYIQQNLGCSLTPGQTYSVSFWAHLAPVSEFGCSDIGAVLSNAPITAANWLHVNTPATITTGANVLGFSGGQNSSTWYPVGGTVTGSGQSWITIGCFTSTPSTPLVNSSNWFDPYYLIDDVSITPLPPVITTTNITVCAGGTFTLGASGGANYTWTGPNSFTATGAPIVVTAPLTPGVYSYTVTTNLSCPTSCSYSTTANVTVTPGPPITVNSPTICAGQTAILNVFGATTYTWIPGNTNGSTLSVSPNSTTIYTVTGSTSGCTSSTTATVTVNPSPIPTFNMHPCSNTSNTITITNAQSGISYSWTPAVVCLPPLPPCSQVSMNPSNGTIYNVVATNTLTGCTSTTTLSTNSSPNPGVSPSQTICTTGAPTYTASIFVTTGFPLTWSTASTGTLSCTNCTTPTVTVSSTTVFSVTVTGINGCSTTKTVTITINPTPMVTVNSPSICPGTTATLTTSGATTYTWLPGNANGTTHIVSPNNTSTYTVTGSTAGCNSSATATVTIKPAPPTFTWSPRPCSGTSNTVSIVSTQTTGITYAWTPSVSCQNSFCSQVVMTPTANVNYTVVATNSAGCTRTVVLAPLTSPGLTVTPTQSNFCAPSPGTTFTTTIIATTNPFNSTVTWQPSGTATFTCNPNCHTATVTISATSVFTVTATGINNCPTTKTVTITVTPTPTINITASPNPVCQGLSATLTATGASNYTWSPSGTLSSNTGATVTATSPTTTNYTVIGSTNTCTASASITLTVTPSSIITATMTTPTVSGCNTAPSPGQNTICQGGSAILNASSSLTSYTWNPGNLTGATVTVTPSSTTTYTVSGSGGAGCPGTQTITVTVSTCTCSGIPLPALTNTSITGGTYVLNSNATVTGAVTLNGTVINIAAGVSITVPSGASLRIIGSHLSPCFDMWQGIIVQSGGRVDVVNGSLIEDAIVAIDNGGSTSNIISGLPSTINVNGAIFNCNRTGIRNAFYQNGLGAPGQNYSNTFFNVNNAVFTCRCNINYPVTMPQLTTYSNSITGIGNLTTPDLSDYYSVANLPLGNLRSPHLNEPPLEGIHFENDGILLIQSTSPLPYLYNVGGANLVLFDNYVYGINAINATFKVINSAFQVPRQLPVGLLQLPLIGGYGIQAINNNKDWYNGIYVNNSRFIDAVRGIHNINYFDIDINTNTLFSRQVIIPAGTGVIIPPHGDYGMFIKTVRWLNANMSSNNVANINHCIDFLIDASTGYNTNNGEHIGPVTVSSNTLGDLFPLNSYTNKYIGNAIVVENVLSVPTSTTVANPTPQVGPISVDRNKITKAFRGILIRNQEWQEVRDESNTITLQYEPTGFSTESTQYGIAHSNVIYQQNANGVGDDIFNNNVTGFTTPADYGNLPFFELKKGIWCNFTGNHYVTCNNVDKAGRAIEFSGNNTPAFWRLNNMSNSGEGYVLSSNGIINTQGTSTNGQDNTWVGFSNTNPETMADNSNATSSILYVQNLTNYVPQNNFFNSGNPYALPLATSNLLQASGPSSNTGGSQPYNCANIPPTIVVNPYGNNNNVTARSGQNTITSTLSDQISYMEKIVQDSIPYTTAIAENSFINKNIVYRTIKQDTTVMTSSTILQNFYVASRSTCRQLFCIIEDSLNKRNYAYAGSLLSSFNPGCTIEQNYKKFYQMYINFMTGISTSSDTAGLETLASLCPMLNGTVVYQARALHNSVYNEFKHYEDNCPQSNNNSQRLSVQTENKNYSLFVYPNPTNGKVYVSGFAVNTKTTGVEVTDITGNIVMKQQVNVSNGFIELSLSLNNGVYFIRLINEKGINEVQKIIINK